MSSHVPLSAASKVEHTRALRVAVAIISLLEQTVELKLLGLRHFDRTVFRHGANNLHGFLELCVAHSVGG